MELLVISRSVCAHTYPAGLELDRLVTEVLRPEGVELPTCGPPLWRPVGTYREEFRPSDSLTASGLISKAIQKLGKPDGIVANDGPYWMAQWRPHFVGSKGYIAGWCVSPGEIEEWYRWATAPRLQHAVCLAGLLAVQSRQPGFEAPIPLQVDLSRDRTAPIPVTYRSGSSSPRHHTQEPMLPLFPKEGTLYESVSDSTRYPRRA